MKEAELAGLSKEVQETRQAVAEERHRVELVKREVAANEVLALRQSREAESLKYEMEQVCADWTRFNERCFQWG